MGRLSATPRVPPASRAACRALCSRKWNAHCESEGRDYRPASSRISRRYQPSPFTSGVSCRSFSSQAHNYHAILADIDNIEQVTQSDGRDQVGNEWLCRISSSNHPTASPEAVFEFAEDTLAHVGSVSRRVPPLLKCVKAAVQEVRRDAVREYKNIFFADLEAEQRVALTAPMAPASPEETSPSPNSPARPHSEMLTGGWISPSRRVWTRSRGCRGRFRESAQSHQAAQVSTPKRPNTSCGMASMISTTCCDSPVSGSLSPQLTSPRLSPSKPQAIPNGLTQETEISKCEGETPLADREVCQLARSCFRCIRKPVKEETAVGKKSSDVRKGLRRRVMVDKHVEVNSPDRRDEGAVSSRPTIAEMRRQSTRKSICLIPSYIRELTFFDAYSLSRRFNLPSGQVTQAWKLFKKYDVLDVGLLDTVEFQLILRALLRDRFPKARDIPRELFDKVEVQAVERGGELDFMDLLQWIAENSFSEAALLSNGERFLRDIARQYGCTVPDVEAIKRSFDKYDDDGSGIIDYTEFGQLIKVLLGVKDEDSLPENRVLAFWRELDQDGSNEVVFKEFIPWYLSYFHTNAEASPIESYYRNIRPVPFHYYSHSN